MDVKSILLEIDEALKTVETPVAAFDADGTLWRHDAGESFFFYEVNNKCVEGLPKEPWKHYLDLKDNVSKDAAYLWLAQINAGKSIDEVRKWAMECVEKHVGGIPYFEEQKEIISHLKASGVDVYVVTASIKWAVEPGAQVIYDIPEENVIGITTKIIDGIVQEEQDGPITYKEGKVTGLLAKTDNVKPFFASGNTEGDLPLLESATHIRLALASANRDEFPDLFDSEQFLQGVARSNEWHHHQF